MFSSRSTKLGLYPESFCLFIYYRILGGNSVPIYSYSVPIYSYIALPCVSVFWRQDGQGGSLMSFVEKVVAQFVGQQD